MTRILIFLGILLIIIGILWPFLKKIGFGHLPGDIVFKRDNFTLYFPIVTCIVLSILLSILLWFLNR